MITTQAACCLISSKPGVANGTTLDGRLSQTVKCGHCEERYAVQYQSGDIGRIVNYEGKLIATAQQKVDESHSSLGHPPIISIWGVE
jgi:hypothetical protein